ncbi:MAG: LysR family transcriptional regulator, partial [Methylococcales bacterium]|nr:LysR family transcriptional regulator [Methylococcales bacterium]
MDKLTSMNVFARVAKAGSFAGAARDLGISRAMATKHIMHLESKLGTRLFNRTT